MARFHLAAALGTAAVALFVTLQLISSFGVAPSTLLHLSSSGSLKFRSFFQTPLRAGNPDFQASTNGSVYLLGVGKADITGPVVEINMMGYADPSQVGSGLRQRIYSRAFIIGEVDKPANRFVYLVLDTQSGDTAIRYGIIQGLATLGSEYSVYGQQNVAVTGTHSHSGPGAWLNYLLPQITSKGFDKQSYQAIVDGALLSIQRAHETLAVGNLTVGTTNVEDANINRSPYAYLANPAEERAQYEYDVDKNMTMLRFTRAGDGLHLGVLTWFPVHGTSMYENNTLISGDNKGVAAYLFEKDVEFPPDDPYTNPFTNQFVAGFSQANVGDTTPNVLGAWCEDGSGEMCNFEDSTCGGRNEPCHGRGPNFTVKDQGATSCFEIGRRQFSAAKSLYDSLDQVGTPIQGSTVQSFHAFQDFSNFTFELPNGSTVTTCPAALGYSFAAGTSDGPGAFDFKQNNSGAPDANPLWAVVSGFLKEPDEQQKACQYPKPILLDVGQIDEPYQWAPNIVDIQMQRVGQLIIVVSPGEATTMSGRRWKGAIKQEAEVSSLTDVEPVVVLGAPANSYTHYIATEEEYGIQRYEGASTLYGPNTLNAYINLSVSYLSYLDGSSSSSPPLGPFPPDYVNQSLSFITGVVFDGTPLFKSFGDVLQDVSPNVEPGENVSATFVGANPRNDLRLESSYAVVEQLSDSGNWTAVRTDADWSLIFSWTRTSSVLGTSEAEITWEIEDDARPASYRIHYYGASKTPVTGSINDFEGISGVFVVG